jgi:hypothetical protein
MEVVSQMIENSEVLQQVGDGNFQILESVHFYFIFLITALVRRFQAMQKASDF